VQSALIYSEKAVTVQCGIESVRFRLEMDYGSVALHRIDLLMAYHRGCIDSFVASSLDIPTDQLLRIPRSSE
jgi:hypothetical protein